MGAFSSIILPDGGDIHHLYLDESGELGSKKNSSDFFIITVLNTANPKALKKRIWKQKAKLYADGWPKGIELLPGNRTVT